MVFYSYILYLVDVWRQNECNFWKEHARFPPNAIRRAVARLPLTVELAIFSVFACFRGCVHVFSSFYWTILILRDFCDFCDPNSVRGDLGADFRKYAISRFFTFFLFPLLLSNPGRLLRKMLLDRREQSIRWSHAYFFCVLWRSQSFFRKIQVFAIPEFCCVLLLVFVRACKRLFLVLEYANNHHVESNFNFLGFLNAVARVLLW